MENEQIVRVESSNTAISRVVTLPYRKLEFSLILDNHVVKIRLVDNQNVWGWTDGTPWSYTNWYRAQPDNGNGRQDFVAINLVTVGLWDDGENNENINRGYICQHSLQ